MSIDPIDLELAVAEGRAMLEAFRRERGVDAAEEIAFTDAVTSLLHGANSTADDPADAIADLMCGVAQFWEDLGRVVTPPATSDLRRRLAVVEDAVVSGNDREARRLLLALARSFRGPRP